MAEAIVEAGGGSTALGWVPATAGNFRCGWMRAPRVTVSGRHKGS
jgi:hypothetical protein